MLGMLQNDDTLIHVADNINMLCRHYQELRGISASQVVVMGTQSSGKSTVVNKLIGFDGLLPVGTNMVTRTPFFIKLLHDDAYQNPHLVMFVDLNGTRQHEFSIMLDGNVQTKLSTFRTKLAELTNIITGGERLISETPIYLNIYWSKIKTSLSFVDLPGRVLIAKDGQADTLKRDIDTLITKQILVANTIVLLVLQSKTDLETDSGLELLKEIEKLSEKSIKTIGVLTKPDTMNKEDLHVLNDFVTGRVDRAVSLTDGYFVVNNKTDNEEQYFLSTFGATSDIVKHEKYGIKCLTQHLKQHLIRSIKSCLPSVKKQITDVLKLKKIEYQSLGGNITENQSKQYFANKIITQLCSELKNSINSESTIDNAGHKIGCSIRELARFVENVEPFEDTVATTRYFQELVKCSRGYRLTSQASLEIMIERCLEEPDYNPLNIFNSGIVSCISEIENTLIETVYKLLNCGKIELVALYPEFKNFLFGTIKEKLHDYCDSTIKEIHKYLNKQKHVVWSTDENFTQLLNQHYYSGKSNLITDVVKIRGAMTALIGNSNYNSKKDMKKISNYFEFSPEQVRSISASYYTTIKHRSKDMFAQDIIFGIVYKMKNEMIGNLLIELLSNNSTNLTELLEEDNSVVMKRTSIKKSIDLLDRVLQEVNTV